MIVPLTHPFAVTASQYCNAILDDCVKLNTFCSRVSKLSTSQLDPDEFKGFALELFAECLLKVFVADKRLGISNYQVVTTGDIGVDGFGVGMNGHPATVQVKFRPAKWILKANEDNLTNFTSASWGKYRVNYEDTNNMLIITTADGLHHQAANEMFQGKVKCITREQLRKLVDNNTVFWNTFLESWEAVVANLTT